MSAIELACASDRRYAPHSAAMLHSALAAGGGLALRVHYLCAPGFPDSDAAAIAGMVEGGGGEVRFHRIRDERLDALPTMDYIGAEMWFRFLLPELVPDADRVLYVDSDVVVADSLAALWGVELGDRYLAAVDNVFERHRVDRPAELGLPPDQGYFNSGVLLLNLARMRADASSEALIELAAARGPELLWPDQDVLNLVLGARRVALAPRWNATNAIVNFRWADEVFAADELAAARRRPAIRHFEGPSLNKPWHYLCDQPGRELYSEHRGATPWPRVRMEGRSPRNVVRRWRDRRRTPVA